MNLNVLKQKMKMKYFQARLVTERIQTNFEKQAFEKANTKLKKKTRMLEHVD